MTKVTIGGERLHSGNKTEQVIKKFNKSNHNLNTIWRSTMATGVLYPCLAEFSGPGDKHEIKLDAKCYTLPTVGPAYVSAKLHVDIFTAPIRLYNKRMMINELELGRKMDKVFLPQIEMEHNYLPDNVNDPTSQINPSSIYAYFDIKGLGRNIEADEDEDISRRFTWVKGLMYWEIFKNYYSNKQEPNAFVIHNDYSETDIDVVQVTLTGDFGTPNNPNETRQWSALSPLTLKMGGSVWNNGALAIWYKKSSIGTPSTSKKWIMITGFTTPFSIEEIFENWEYDTEKINDVEYNRLRCWNPYPFGGFDVTVNQEWSRPLNIPISQSLKDVPQLVEFPLENIDKMREEILEQDKDTPLIIDKNSIAPYGLGLTTHIITDDEGTSIQVWSKQSSQEGLAVRTYKSDKLQNWINGDWISSANGVDQLTAIDTSSGNFTVNSLNLSNKLYNMMNRIAISGGSLDEWQEAVYSQSRIKMVSSPVYRGSLIKDIRFEEVISNSESENQPLGTLGGRGVMENNKIGGYIKINSTEPEYIIGIASIVPNIDYSMGNKWDNNLKTLDDFHKPDLDAIGYQDVITDEMHWADTAYDANNQNIVFKSAGKTVSWLNYMTSINKCYGNFADPKKEAFMVWNRNYEIGLSGIQDLTTYIDPSKFNYIFSATTLDAMNFQVQIGIQHEKRWVGAAQQIPNL